MADSKLILETDFHETRAVRARLDALLLLAQAVRPHLTDLFRATETAADGPSWDQIMIVLAQSFASQIKRLTTVSEVVQLWHYFMNDILVGRVGEGARRVLEEMNARLLSLLRMSENAIDYLQQANLAAAKAVGEILQRHPRLYGKKTVDPVPLIVGYDPEASQFCASSAWSANQIRWELQLVEHSFYGALIAPLVLRHEYFSHLLPRSWQLSRIIREIWLVVALDEEHRNSNDSADQKIVERYLWQKFRYQLACWFNASDIDVFGPLNVDALARRLYVAHPDAFWEVTRMAMTAETLTASEATNDLIMQMAELSDDLLRRIIGKIMASVPKKKKPPVIY